MENQLPFCLYDRFISYTHLKSTNWSMNWENRPTRINFCPVAQAGKERKKNGKEWVGVWGVEKRGEGWPKNLPHMCVCWICGLMWFMSWNFDLLKGWEIYTTIILLGRLWDKWCACGRSPGWSLIDWFLGEGSWEGIGGGDEGVVLEDVPERLST